MKSALYVGKVMHSRTLPVLNRFRYSIYMVYLDLSELDIVFRGRLLWSMERPNIHSFRRSDHVGDPQVDLLKTIGNMVEEETGCRPPGPIRLLTQLRHFGQIMNPVSFYFCWNSEDTQVETIVAEVHNTPWGETHCYVLPITGDNTLQETIFRFAKKFHVSPFMPMMMDYVWRLSQPCETIQVQMQNWENDCMVFEAVMQLSRRQVSGRNLASISVSYPLCTLKVVGAIYYQAMRLWIKRAPFYPHPNKAVSPKEKVL